MAIPDITPHDGRTSYSLVWDVNALVWVTMQQPILNAGSVTLSGTVDVSDRTARVFGHVIVDTAPTTAVTGTFFQATQPVSGTFFQSTQPVSGTFLIPRPP